MEFRESIKAWLEENCPPSMRTPMPNSEQVWASSKISFPSKEAEQWFKAMTAKGFCTPDWPQEYGGAGLNHEEIKILKEELLNINARPAQINFGISMLGPIILEYANKEQKELFLPKISRGEIWWCQGFSEPGSGSDLASLSTSAAKDGDYYVINGAKIWTSEANKADYMYCLVRTSKESKQGGISFVLIDMNSEGIEVKPIKLLSGQSPFCQVFFSDVRVPVANLIGQENQGWEIAKRLLALERMMMSDLGSEGAVDVNPARLFKEKGLNKDTSFYHNITRHSMRQHAIDLTMSRAAMEARLGSFNPSMVLKYLSTEEVQKRWELNLYALGSIGIKDLESAQGDEFDIIKSFFYSKAYTIAGGSSEIQLNIISKNILGLPNE